MLSKQRLNRPVSPHLEIYKIEQTYLGSSAWMRITGCTLTGAAYAYFACYLVAPAFGWNLDSAAVADAFAGLPFAAKSLVKFALAFPFSFHLLNGVKQLVYDMGIGYKKTTIVKADYYVWLAAAVGGLLVTFGL
ncbi:uncharacterized protein UV8b_06473 [Ustilaginoidea virens]|nr:uncharacterized protein UV8b_06473 [Ustilaginoidea virens]QUC22232.1 hypothetical protein UV8b_06473 [Ustilaginoidea virens]